MFDRYAKIQHIESHGDIIVWPMKALAAYLLSTGDTAFLHQKLEYTQKEIFEFTEKKEMLLHHVKKEVQNIRQHLIEGTYLSCYGDRDWDDTLQPMNAALRKSLVSGWTVALTYQTLKEFAEAICMIDKTYANALDQLAENIKRDFRRYIIKDGIAAGFVLFEKGEEQCQDKDQGHIKYLLHPKDEETGLTYRLLPMTRSMKGKFYSSRRRASDE